MKTLTVPVPFSCIDTYRLFQVVAIGKILKKQILIFCELFLIVQRTCNLTLMIRTGRRREGDPIVGANERRRAIIEVLCQRKQDTMKNLANEFHVSLRTICYDIDELARNYPIVAIRGKYKGGVRIADGYRLDRKYLNHEQQRLLKRLSKTLSGEDRNIMESILRDFTLKEISEADPGY